MQEPTSCDQFLFYSENMMQVNAMSMMPVGAILPYLGGYDQIGNLKELGRHDMCRIVQGHPKPGHIGGYSATGTPASPDRVVTGTTM